MSVKKKKSLYLHTIGFIEDANILLNQYIDKRKGKVAVGAIYDKAVLGEAVKDILSSNNVPKDEIEKLTERHEYLFRDGI